MTSSVLKVLNKIYRPLTLGQAVATWIRILSLSVAFVYFLAIGGAHEIPGWDWATLIGLIAIVGVLVNQFLATLASVMNKMNQLRAK